MDINSYALSRELGALLQKKKLKLTVAESCTGGGLCQAITAVSGSSAWFECGFITYSIESKKKLLGVDPKIIETHGVVSEAVAREMAIGALRNCHAQISLSITGIAGPKGGTAEIPVGTVWFGLGESNGQCFAQRGFFEGGRQHVRLSAIVFALGWLLQTVEQDF